MSTLPLGHQTLFVKFRPESTVQERDAIITEQYGGQLAHWLPQIHTAIVHVPEAGAARMLALQNSDSTTAATPAAAPTASTKPELTVSPENGSSGLGQLIGLIVRLFRLISGGSQGIDSATSAQKTVEPAASTQPLGTLSRSIVRIEADGIVAGCADEPIGLDAAAATTPSSPAASPRTVNDPELETAYGLNQIRSIQAWEEATGQGAIVAILDTGIDLNHPEFTGRIFPGYNFVDDSENVQDDNGHGSHVAGIVGAAYNNGQGAAGVAPECTLLSIKVLDSKNLGAWSSVVSGILFAVEQGAHIINLSLGSSSLPPTAVLDAIEVAAQHSVIVAAAGNSATSGRFYPAAYDSVVAVGATNRQGTRWGPSNYGDWVTLAAPGENIFSATKGQQYEFRSGTSMAAAFVSGVAALVYEVHSQEPTSIVQQVIGTAEPIDGENATNPQLGAGRVDALGAVGGEHKIFIPFVAG